MHSATAAYAHAATSVATLRCWSAACSPGCMDQAGHSLRHGVAHGQLHGVLRPGAGVVGFYMRRLDGGLALTPALSRGERE